MLWWCGTFSVGVFAHGSYRGLGWQSMLDTWAASSQSHTAIVLLWSVSVCMRDFCSIWLNMETSQTGWNRQRPELRQRYLASSFIHRDPVVRKRVRVIASSVLQKECPHPLLYASPLPPTYPYSSPLSVTTTMTVTNNSPKWIYGISAGHT